MDVRLNTVVEFIAVFKKLQNAKNMLFDLKLEISSPKFPLGRTAEDN
jgi:hypothetical protein